MPVQLSYPGVYIQEIPSGVRTITGVPTAITAFIGRAAKGPLDTAVTITSYADYERTFGGLAAFSFMSFAVRDYFANGGSTAVIVRLYQTAVGPPAPKAAKTTFDVGQLRFEASSEGTWGQGLRITVDTDVPAGMAASMGVPADKIFNLAATDVNSGQAEYFSNLTVADHAQRVDRVLAAQSQLLRWRGNAPTTALTVAAGRDAVGAAVAAYEDARKQVPLPANIDALKAAIDTAKAALVGNDGANLTEANFAGVGFESGKKGLYALEQADLFNILCIPPYAEGANVSPQIVGLAASYCEKRRAFYVIDPPVGWNNPADVVNGMKASPDPIGTRSKNAAIFWPRLRQPNPFKGDLVESFAPSGAVAGVMARTDAERGVWKAPAGLAAVLNNVPDLAYPMTDGEHGLLNPLGVNALRIKAPVGRITYGARTLEGDDRLGSEYKYISVRRLALFIEESVYRGTQWAVFEPNDEALWAQIRLNLTSFMQGLYRKGAFDGKSESDAFYVKCDSETTTPGDVNLGILNIVIGFQPPKPAEFVVISLKQIARA